MTADQGDSLLRFLGSVSEQLACLLDIDGQHHGRTHLVSLPITKSSISSIKQGIKLDKKIRNHATLTATSSAKTSTNAKNLKLNQKLSAFNDSHELTVKTTKRKQQQEASRSRKRRKRRNVSNNSNSNSKVPNGATTIDERSELEERKQLQQQHHLNNHLQHQPPTISFQTFNDAQSSLDAQLNLEIGDDMTLTTDHGTSISPSATHLSPIDPSIASFGSLSISQIQQQLHGQPQNGNVTSNNYYRGVNSSQQHNNSLDAYLQIQDASAHHEHHHHQLQQHQQQLNDFVGSSGHDTVPLASVTLNSNQSLANILDDPQQQQHLQLNHNQGQHQHQQAHLHGTSIGIMATNQVSDSIDSNSLTPDCYQHIQQQQQHHHHHNQQHHHHQQSQQTNQQHHNQHHHHLHHHQHQQQQTHEVPQQQQHRVHNHHQLNSYNQIDHQWLTNSTILATSSSLTSANAPTDTSNHHLHQETIPMDHVVSSLSPTSVSQQPIDQVHFAPLYHHSYYSSHQADQLDSFQQLTTDEFTTNSSEDPVVQASGGVSSNPGQASSPINHILIPSTQGSHPSKLALEVHQHQISQQQQSTNDDPNNNNNNNNNNTNYDQHHQHEINSAYHDHHHHHHHHNLSHSHHEHNNHHHHHHHHHQHNLGHHQHQVVMPLVNGIEPSSVILQDINLASATWSSPEDLYSI